VQECCLI